MRKTLWLGVILLSAGAPCMSYAASVPDPVSGKKFAQIECGRCHVIDEERGKTPPAKTPGAAPHFKTIAFDPEMSVEKIRDTLKLPHGSMANVLLAEKDIDNIISYIVGLRRN